MIKKPVTFGSARALREHVLASIENTLLRTRDAAATLLQGGMVAGALVMGATTGMAGCGVAPEGAEAAQEALIGLGQTDWAQQQGQRNTYWISYTGQNWNACTQQASRFGCTVMTYYFKMAVRPAPGANLSTKRVGLVYREPGTTSLTSVTGSYYTTLADGREEWHVPIAISTSAVALFSFNAWYQDGLGNTYYDDNNGELHAYSSNTYNAIRHDTTGTTVTVTSQGVQGKISEILADIDYDKEVIMMWSTDNWATSNTMTMGTGVNQWHFAEDITFGGRTDDYERWEATINIPGNFQNFQYAIRYRHGVTSGATSYTYWDNNGGYNYIVYRQ